jgi:hypothetical protein
MPYCSHLGHPRVTIARQSDWALFTLGISLANSAPLCTGKKVALELPEVNKPREMISGVGISVALQYIQISAIEVTSVRCGYDLDSCQIESKNNLFGISLYCLYGMCCDALAVPSDEHTPLSEIVV